MKFFGARRFAKLAVFMIAAVFIGSQSVDAERFPKGMKEGRNSARTPSIENGTVTFTIFHGDCQSRTYGDGRGESDCLNKNSKSYLSAGDVRINSSMYYAFDVRVPSGLTHKAFHNPRMVPFTGGPDSRLSVAIWQGNLIKNHLVWLDLDRSRGLTFMGKRCASASGLQGWTRFEMWVKWSAKGNGKMLVKCNGQTIYSVTDQPTDQNTFCNISTHCAPGEVKHPRKINAGYGIFFDSEYVNDQEIWPRVPKNGLVVQMRNFSQKKIRW